MRISFMVINSSSIQVKFVYYFFGESRLRDNNQLVNAQA